MPLYDYKCPVCGSEQEVMHSIAESPEVRCECTKDRPVCVRLIGLSSFVLKGSCWAKDGYTGQTKTKETTKG